MEDIEKVAISGAVISVLLFSVISTKLGRQVATDLLNAITHKTRPCTHQIVAIKNKKAVYCVYCNQPLPKLKKGEDLNCR